MEDSEHIQLDTRTIHLLIQGHMFQ